MTTKFRQLLLNADDHKRLLIELDEAVSLAARRSVGKALSPGITRIIAELIGAELDIATILREGARAARRAESQLSLVVKEAWDAGIKIGRQHAFEEARILGVALKEIPIPTFLLEEIQATVSYNTQSIQDLVLQASQQNSREEVLDELAKVERRIARRAAAATSTAINRGYNESQLALWAQTGLSAKKLWIANITTATCPICLALHGSTVDISRAFDSTRSFASSAPPRPFVDLEVPPRHPHCRCRIVVIPDTVIAAIPRGSLRRAAQRRAKAVFGDDAALALLSSASTITASDLRALDPSQVKAALITLRNRL